MKKLSIFLLCTMLIFNASVFSFAAEKSPNLDNIRKEYNLKTIDKVPENIKPIEFKNEKELVNFLEKVLNQEKIDITEEITIDNSQSLGFNTLSSGETYVTTYKKTNSYTTWKHFLIAKIEVYKSGSFGQIQKVISLSTNAQGLNMGVDYEPDPYASGHHIASDKQSVELWGAGNVEYYLLIDGVFQLYTDYVEITGRYTIN